MCYEGCPHENPITGTCSFVTKFPCHQEKEDIEDDADELERLFEPTESEYKHYYRYHPDTYGLM